MKKLFGNFSWKVMVSYMLVFGSISLLFDWLMGKFKEVDFSIPKYFLGFCVKVALFGFIMSLIFDKKILKQHQEKQ